MKKILSIVVAACILIGLSGCGTASSSITVSSAQTEGVYTNLEQPISVQEGADEEIQMTTNVPTSFAPTPTPTSYEPEPYNAIPANSQIIQDVKQSIDTYGLEITEVNTIKSKTDEQDGEYTAYLEILAVSEDVECTWRYKVDYTLYNEGWMLENIEGYDFDFWDSKPLHGIPEDELIYQIPDVPLYPEPMIISNEVDLGARTQYVECEYTEIYPLCTVQKRGTFVFRFVDFGVGDETANGYWAYNDFESNTETISEDWNINGRWYSYNTWDSDNKSGGYEFIDVYNVSSDFTSLDIDATQHTYGYPSYYHSSHGTIAYASTLANEMSLDLIVSMYGIPLNYVTTENASPESLSYKKSSNAWQSEFCYVIEFNDSLGIGGYSRLYEINKNWESIQKEYEKASMHKIFISYEYMAIPGDLALDSNGELTLVFNLLLPSQ